MLSEKFINTATGNNISRVRSGKNCAVEQRNLFCYLMDKIQESFFLTTIQVVTSLIYWDKIVLIQHISSKGLFLNHYYYFLFVLVYEVCLLPQWARIPLYRLLNPVISLHPGNHSSFPLDLWIFCLLNCGFPRQVFPFPRSLIFSDILLDLLRNSFITNGNGIFTSFPLTPIINFHWLLLTPIWFCKLN